MQISRRTKISLSQLLHVIDNQVIHVILDKYDLETYAANLAVDLNEIIKSASANQLSDLVIEVISTGSTLRNSTSPKYQYDVQFEEFRKSLLLDGYLIEDKVIKALDPNFKGHEPVEDALIMELKNSDLDHNEEVKRCILSSASDFVKAQPDYNGSLTNIRVALETTVREIALNKGFTTNLNGNTWGPSLAYLKNDGFLDQKEEKALASIFTFISNGAHVPIGFSKEEFVRLGRNICSSMCYFVVKKYNA